jgi:molecular chaperone GrpE (heat shock protein)
MIFDIQAELAALPALKLPESGPADDTPSVGTVSQALTKLARQQFKAGQLTEHALEQLRLELEQTRSVSDERRREIERWKLDAEETRVRLIESLDALDDLMVMAKQREDEFWIGRLTRLESRFTALLQALGVTELPGIGHSFDEYLHDVLEVTDTQAGAQPHTVVEQVKKGYRYDGRVMRRAQVITSK